YIIPNVMPINSVSSGDGRLPRHEVINDDFCKSRVVHFVASLELLPDRHLLITEANDLKGEFRRTSPKEHLSSVRNDLKSKEKDRYNADIRATNILLQGFPKDINTLINHHTDAKDILDNVKMLLEGSELSKEDRESQLYMILNTSDNIRKSQFMTTMSEWGRFVTAVKLNRGLRDSNYDQLFAYLKQHEAHAMENKMLLERLSQPTAQPTADPLALLSNVSNTQHGSPSSSTSPFTQLPPSRANSSSPADDLIENLTSTLALLTQLYRTFLLALKRQTRMSSV
nr:hypothetical protein [Tanacetum cinerariifolium]